MCNKEMSEEKYDKIVLRLVEGEDVYIETPWVIDLGEGRYRMENSPFYFYGVAAGDIVGAEYSEEEERLVFTKVLEKSGNKLVRVIFENPADQEGPEKEHLKKLVEMGCNYEGANPKYICIDIPKDVDLFKVCNYLTENNIQWEHAAPRYSELYPDEE
jgi:hypothetical protein